MVDGTEQARGFTQQGLGGYTPTHKSHKEVEAYPIAAAEFQADGSGKVCVHVRDGTTRIVPVPPGFLRQPGAVRERDMLVRYAPTVEEPNGYLSHSPRAVFDAGYTPIGSAPAAGNMADAISVLFATFRDELRKLGDSRELAVALTHLDTARLWAREHAAR